MKDEIVEEVRAAREVYAARFNYDLTEMYYDLTEMYKDPKRKEETSGRNMAALQRVEPGPGAERPGLCVGPVELRHTLARRSTASPAAATKPVGLRGQRTKAG